MTDVNTRADLSTLKVSELQAIAASLGMSGASKLRKGELVEAIRLVQEGATELPAGSPVTLEFPVDAPAEAVAPTIEESTPAEAAPAEAAAAEQAPDAAAAPAADEASVPAPAVDGPIVPDELLLPAPATSSAPKEQIVIELPEGPVSPKRRPSRRVTTDRVSAAGHANTDGATEAPILPAADAPAPVSGSDTAEGDAAAGEGQNEQSERREGRGRNRNRRGRGNNDNAENGNGQNNGGQNGAAQNNGGQNGNAQNAPAQNGNGQNGNAGSEQADRNQNQRGAQNGRSQAAEREAQKQDADAQRSQGQQNQNQDRGPQLDGDDRNDRGARNRYRDRKRRGQTGGDEIEPEISEDDVLIPVAGILDILDNYAFVRTSGYLPGNSDVYVSLGQVKKYNLRKGDAVVGSIRQPREGDSSGRQKYNAIVRIESINGLPVDEAQNRVGF
uniref:Rho termination factor N-terminal domain-containing protein n=1 Tax=Herbiconiux sp. TaxID=1871186 RepID=UPI0025BAAAB4